MKEEELLRMVRDRVDKELQEEEKKRRSWINKQDCPLCEVRSFCEKHCGQKQMTTEYCDTLKKALMKENVSS